MSLALKSIQNNYKTILFDHYIFIINVLHVFQYSTRIQIKFHPLAGI